MATAYLQGGACDGRTHTITPAEADEGVIVCSGDLYRVTSPPRHRRGNLIFAFAGKAPAAEPPPTLKAPQALRGWSDMQRSVNRHMPAALQHSAHVRHAAWRKLGHAGKVRV